MRIRLIFPIGLAILLILALYTILAGQAVSTSDYTLATADGLALSLSADGQVTSLQLDGAELVSTPAPALLLRDLSDAGNVITPNLVINPGFEDELTGWTQLVNSGLEVSVVASPTHSGNGALELANPVTDTYAFAAYVSDPVPITPKQRYRISAWFRSATGYVSRPSGSPVMWQKDLWRNSPHTNGLYVQWLDADGQPLGDPQLAVPLHWNAAHWRLIRRELTAPSDAAQARTAVGALLTGQTLWVDDVTFVPALEQEVAVMGTVTPCGSGFVEAYKNSGKFRGSQGNSEGCLVQSASLPESGLLITVTYTAHADHIAVHGEVVDTTGEDRALDITWGIPIDAQSGTWWDDVHTSRPITDAGTYAHAISAIYDGWLPISLYPYAGVQISGKGVALGLPLDRPQLALLAYDGAAGRYGATFHLGISPQAVKVGPRATFDLMLYRFDPAWGFRDVIARHRALQPDAYTTELPLYDYSGFEQGSYFTENGAQRALDEDAANIYSAQYTGCELPLTIVPSNEPRPTLDQVLTVVSETLSSPRPWDAALARAITQSATMDPNGDWSLKHVGVFVWAPDWWQAAWAANLDPDLDDGLASWNLDWRVTPAFTMTTQIGAHLDGVQIDNFMSSPTLDLRPEALAAADWPLAYTPHTYQPAVHNGFAFREYLAFLRDYLDTNWGTDRGITINFWGLGHPNYLAEYIDGFGSEGELKGNGEGPNWNPEILDYRRAIAYGRPYLFANQTTGLTASEAYTFTRLALLYGVLVGAGPNAAGWEPEAQQIVSDTHELVTQYWAAGWEPLTRAWADNEDVWVERFGSTRPIVLSPRSSVKIPDYGLRTSDYGLFFTVHSTLTETLPFTLTVDAASLGIAEPISLTVTELVSGEMVPYEVQGSLVLIRSELDPLGTLVFRLEELAPTPHCLYLPLMRKE